MSSKDEEFIKSQIGDYILDKEIGSCGFVTKIKFRFFGSKNNFFRNFIFKKYSS